MLWSFSVYENFKKRSLSQLFYLQQYLALSLIQNAAAKMINNGDKEGAIDLLTSYSTAQANMWLNTWKDLQNDLITKYMHTNTNMKVSTPTAWWTENVKNKGLK